LNDSPRKGRLGEVRERLDGRPALRLLFRIGVAVAGTAVLVLGIVLIPYPGPGWLVVFAGLAILATEFSWAGRLLTYARGRYGSWTRWLGRQHWAVKLMVLVATAVVVVAFLWLLNALWTVAGWVGLDTWTWLRSPVG
jgi:uncharacterized protein (TIGR02611 family)